MDGEASFEAWAGDVLGEVSMPTLRKGSRGSAVSDLQTRLNAWIAAGSAPGVQRLAVDGDFGPLTQAAVMAYQRAKGLTVDGIVGPQTWGSLLGSSPSAPISGAPSPARGGVNTQLPASGPGYYSKDYPLNTERRYGLPETIRALQSVGAAWQRANPSGPRIGIGDISFKGGGPMSPHSSHQRGVDVDIRPVRNDGQEAPVTHESPDYSQALTQQLVNLVLAQKVLGVRTILFNDAGVRQVKSSDGHDNHLHVSFLAPAGGREVGADPWLGEAPSGGPSTAGRPSLADYATFNRSAIDQVRSAGKRLDCADLAIEIWIAFAERFRIPVSFRMWDSDNRKYKMVGRARFRSAAAFTKYIQSNLGALGLIGNTYAVPGGHRAAHAGDVFLWEYRHQTTNRRHRWGHTQLLYGLRPGAGGPDTDRIVIAQGTLPPIVPVIVEKPASYFSTRRAQPMEGQPHWGIPIGPGPRRFKPFQRLA